VQSFSVWLLDLDANLWCRAEGDARAGYADVDRQVWMYIVDREL
jgi:hypothetical protein